MSYTLLTQYDYRKRKRLFSYTQDKEFCIDERYYTVPAGYQFDGASVPRLLWWLFVPAGLALEAASLHDWLYDNRGFGVLSRKRVDKIFYDHLRQDGAGRLQAYLMYLAVRTPVGLWYWRRDSYPHYLQNA